MRLSDIMEKYTSANSYLKKYLDDPDANILYDFWPKFHEEWIEYSEDFIDWWNDAHPNDDIDPDYPPSDMPDRLKTNFIDDIKHEMMFMDQQTAPSYVHMVSMKDRLLPANSWLVHFSNNAYSIAASGFKIGVDDMSRLGLTTYIRNDSYQKAHGGYNFAFSANDPQYYNNGTKYGEHFVMFQNSGVEVLHRGDMERQIIFHGSDVDPRGIILVLHTNDYWNVMANPNSKNGFNSYGELKVLVKLENIRDAVEWVIKNHSQYRRLLTGY